MSSLQNLLLTVRERESMKDGGESDQGRANTKPEDLLDLSMTGDELRSPLSKTSSTKEPGEL